MLWKVPSQVVFDGGAGEVGAGGGDETTAETGSSSSHHPTIAVSWMDTLSQNFQLCSALVVAKEHSFDRVGPAKAVAGNPMDNPLTPTSQ